MRLLVVVEEKHVLAVVVCGQHEFDEEEIVAHDRIVEIILYFLVKHIIVGRCHEVHCVPERSPVNLLLLPVGIFDFVAGPRLLLQIVVVSAR